MDKETINVSIELGEDGVYGLNDDAGEDEQFRGDLRIDISMADFNEYLEVGQKFLDMQEYIKMLYNDARKKRRSIEWSKNIAENYNDETQTNILAELRVASEEMGLDFAEVDKRWQYFTAGEYVKWEDIAYLLTGKEV